MSLTSTRKAPGFRTVPAAIVPTSLRLSSLTFQPPMSTWETPALKSSMLSEGTPEAAS
ncbi:hypothetical protein SRABI128_04481 [Microbacterium sp. Bi128]|nr:hypothetical protein SRABI128_04481 [Microbacterium sp. Bi128]